MTVPRFNLIQQPPRRGLSAVDMWLVAAIMGACALFVVYGMRLDRSVAATETRIVETDRTLAELRGQLPAIAGVKRENEALSQQLAAITQLRSDPVRYANLLWELGELVPPSVRIEALQIDPATQTVTLSGVSTSAGGVRPLDTVGTLLKRLHASRYYREPSLATSAATTVASGPAWSFSINARYDAQAALQRVDR